VTELVRDDEITEEDNDAHMESVLDRYMEHIIERT